MPCDELQLHRGQPVQGEIGDEAASEAENEIVDDSDRAQNLVLESALLEMMFALGPKEDARPHGAGINGHSRQRIAQAVEVSVG